MQLINNNYDLIFLGIIIASGIFALIRGGINEILSLSSWFIALWAMHRYGELVNKFIPLKISNPIFRSILIYLIIFIAIAIIITIIKRIFASLISKLGLGGLNILIGLIFGIIRGVFLCSLVVIIINIFNLDPGHTYSKSKTYLIIKPVVAIIISAIPESLKDTSTTKVNPS